MIFIHMVLVQIDVSRAGDIRVASLKDIEKFDYTLTNEEREKLYISQGIWKVDSIFQLSLELYDTKKEKFSGQKTAKISAILI